MSEDSGPLRSVAKRVIAIQDHVNRLVQENTVGTYAEGPEALNAELWRQIESVELVSEDEIDVANVGVFPGNREKSMLVPADMQGLLADTFYINGFNPAKWDCVALSVPPALKADWLRANQDLVAKAGGLLPAIHDLDLATGIGSHGTSALRALKFGCTAIHPHIADDNGKVSFAKMLAKQPSMNKPVVQGVKIKIIRGELEVACPGTFQLLSRLGNVSNSHYRLQTTLQSCMRIHNLAIAQKGASGQIVWEQVANQAKIGMTTAESDNVLKLCAFVKHWSGGDLCEVLIDLESFEKTLHHRRYIPACLLAVLAECDHQYPQIVQVHFIEFAVRAASCAWFNSCSSLFVLRSLFVSFVALLRTCAHQGHKYLCQGVVKAMLQSPSADQGGFADLFTVADLNRFKIREKVLMSRVQVADTAITSIITFLKAYGKFSPDEYNRLRNLMEVRAIMLAWNKKAGTRATYSSQEEVMLSVFTEAKTIDPKLPSMPELEAVSKLAAKNTPASARDLVNIGTVEDHILESKGYTIGVIIQNKDNNKFKISCLNSDLKHITVFPYEDGAEETEKDMKTIARTDLALYKVEAPLVLKEYNDIPDAADNVSLVKTIVQGVVAQALLKEFAGSAEKHNVLTGHVRISQLNQTLVVTVKKKFAESKMVLIPLTSMVSVSEQTSIRQNEGKITIGSVQISGKTFNIGLKSVNTHLVNSTEKARKDAFVSTFWILDKYKTDDARKANCELTNVPVTVTVGQEKIILTLPTITNSKALVPLDELVLLSMDESEPAKKKRKSKK